MKKKNKQGANKMRADKAHEMMVNSDVNFATTNMERKSGTNLSSSLSNRHYLIVPMQQSAKYCAHPFQ